MKKTLTALILTAFVVFYFGAVLKNVEITGLKTVKLDELKPFYQTYLEKDVNDFAIRDIVGKIDDTGYFDSVQFELITNEDGSWTLKISVIETDPVEKVNLEIVGPEIISKETLNQAIKVTEKKAFSFNDFWDTIDELTKLYEKEGYIVANPKSQDKSFAFVNVSGRISGNQVTFKVEHYFLKDVEYEFDSEEIQKEFEKVRNEFKINVYKDYESKNWFLRIFDSEKNYVPKLSDIQRLVQSLSKYLIFNVTNFSTVEEREPYLAKTLVIGMSERIVLSQPAYVQGVRVSGNTVYSQKDLIGPTREGTITNLELLKLVQAVKDSYDKAGYFINYGLSADDEGYIVINVNEIKVNSVKYEGLSKTKEYTFNDLVFVKPGDFLNRNALQLTYIELTKLNFFDSVDFNFQQISQDKADVVLKIEEKKKNFDFSGGFTFGPVKDRPWYEGLGGLLTLSATNAFGYGENFSINFQRLWATTTISLNAGMRKPFELPLWADISYSYNSSTVSDSALATETTSNSITSSISTIKLPIGTISAKAGWTTKTIVESTGTESTPTAYDYFTVGGDWVYETLDNLFVPMKGYSLSALVSRILPLSDNAPDTLRIGGELTFHLPLNETFSLAHRSFGSQVFDYKNVESEYLLKLEGLNSVRSLKISESGKVLVLMNNEIRYKEPGQSVYFSLFYDLGYIGNDWSEFEFSKVKQSTGVELGLVVPMFGLIRLGYGFDVLNNFKGNIYFLIGKTF